MASWSFLGGNLVAVREWDMSMSCSHSAVVCHLIYTVRSWECGCIYSVAVRHCICMVILAGLCCLSILQAREGPGGTEALLEVPQS